jgi:citrate lyase subunit beta / citryl-CoA lyase
MGPLRTALFAPGSRAEIMDKAINSNADAIILDLEDAVPNSEKEKARILTRAVIVKTFNKKIYVRINRSYLQEDLQAVGCNNLTGIMLPKVESYEDILELDRLLTGLEKEANMNSNCLEIISICESAKGLQDIYSIVSVKQKLQRDLTVAFGAADYSLDLGINLTREGKELDYPRSRIPVACRAAGIMPPLDTPWMIDIKDIDGLIADAKKAKGYGFQGKILIHPNQIQPCNDVFTPSEYEIFYAKRIIAAFEEAESEGKAALQLDGKFIDYAVVKKSKKLCEFSQAIEDIKKIGK